MSRILLRILWPLLIGRGSQEKSIVWIPAENKKSKDQSDKGNLDHV